MLRHPVVDTYARFCAFKFIGNFDFVRSRITKFGRRYGHRVSALLQPQVDLFDVNVELGVHILSIDSPTNQRSVLKTKIATSRIKIFKIDHLASGTGSAMNTAFNTPFCRFVTVAAFNGSLSLGPRKFSTSAK